MSIPWIVVVFAIGVHLSGAVLYMIVWKVLYNHNKKITSTISRQQAKKRLRKSAVSLVCEMYLYGVDSIILLLLALVINYGSVTCYNLVWIMYQFSFPIRNSIQALSADQTRSIFCNCIDRVVSKELILGVKEVKRFRGSHTSKCSREM